MKTTTPIVIFDFNRTLYSPDSDGLMSGAYELLSALKNRGLSLYLLSRLEGNRSQILNTLDIEKFFTKTLFVPEKSPGHIHDIIENSGADPQCTYVVGDYLHAEIRYGNMAGAKTIWLKAGPFMHLTPETEHDIPWRTVAHLREVLPLISVT